MTAVIASTSREMVRMASAGAPAGAKMLVSMAADVPPGTWARSHFAAAASTPVRRFAPPPCRGRSLAIMGTGLPAASDSVAELRPHRSARRPVAFRVQPERGRALPGVQREELHAIRSARPVEIPEAGALLLPAWAGLLAGTLAAGGHGDARHQVRRGVPHAEAVRGRRIGHTELRRGPPALPRPRPGERPLIPPEVSGATGLAA